MAALDYEEVNNLALYRTRKTRTGRVISERSVHDFSCPGCGGRQSQKRAPRPTVIVRLHIQTIASAIDEHWPPQR